MSQLIPQSYGTSLDILGWEKVLCMEMMDQQHAVMLEHGCNNFFFLTLFVKFFSSLTPFKIFFSK